MPKRKGKRTPSKPLEHEINQNQFGTAFTDINNPSTSSQPPYHTHNPSISTATAFQISPDAQSDELTSTNQNSVITSYPDPYGKYWAQRYRLFSKYDEGIILDEEGWYSVTPELIAAHISERIWKSLSSPSIVPLPKKKARYKQKKAAPMLKRGPGLIMDAFCGPGGNTIQFAKYAPPGGLVFAFDIDPNKIQMAKHNASIYGVQNRIEFILGDSLCISKRFRVDAVFLSPPWGGPEYIQSDTYDLSSVQPIPGDMMYRQFRELTNNIALLLPRNVDQSQVVQLSDPNESVEIEGNYLSSKLKTVTAYFGALVEGNKGNEVIHYSNATNIQELPFIHVEEEEEDV